MERCLTVYPYWGWAIIHGDKRIENRTWFTNYRGRLWIHSGRDRAPTEPEFATLIQHRIPLAVQSSAIIGCVELVDVVPLREVASQDYATGPWCWVLEKPRAVKPIPCRGYSSLWTMPQAVQRVALRTRIRR